MQRVLWHFLLKYKHETLLHLFVWSKLALYILWLYVCLFAILTDRLADTHVVLPSTGTHSFTQIGKKSENPWLTARWGHYGPHCYVGSLRPPLLGRVITALTTRQGHYGPHYQVESLWPTLPGRVIMAHTTRQGHYGPHCQVESLWPTLPSRVIMALTAR